MDKNDLNNVFARYLAGKADQEDFRQLNSWLKASEDNKKIFHSITEYWDVEKKFFRNDSERLADNLIQKIRKTEPQPEVLFPVEHKTRKKSFLYSRIAAVMAGIILIGGCLFFLDQTDWFGTMQKLPIKYVEKYTNPGEKLKIQLPDGTVVKLNYDSKLIFPEKFAEGERSVKLVGEAYFEVSENPDKPFKVTAGELTTTVLGTTFNIRAFPQENDITVAVTSGNVRVEKTKSMNSGIDPVLLSKEEMVVYSRQREQTTKSNFDYMKIIGWKDGIIYFKNADVYEILRTLEQWYGVTFKINGKLNENKGFTITYEDKSLEAILNGLGFTFDFSYTVNDKIINIKSDGRF